MLLVRHTLRRELILIASPLQWNIFAMLGTAGCIGVAIVGLVDRDSVQQLARTEWNNWSPAERSNWPDLNTLISECKRNLQMIGVSSAVAAFCLSLAAFGQLTLRAVIVDEAARKAALEEEYARKTARRHDRLVEVIASLCSRCVLILSRAGSRSRAAAAARGRLCAVSARAKSRSQRERAQAGSQRSASESRRSSSFRWDRIHSQCCVFAAIGNHHLWLVRRGSWRCG